MDDIDWSGLWLALVTYWQNIDWERVSGTLLNLSSGVFGGVIVYFLTELATRRREAQAHARLKRSVGTLIALEVSKNFELMDRITEVLVKLKITSRIGDDSTRAHYASYAASVLDTMPPDEFATASWQSQMTTVPIVFEPKNVAGLYQFYTLIAELQSIRATMSRLRDQEESALAAHAALGRDDLPMPPQAYAFTSSAYALINRFEGAMREARRIEEPIPPHLVP